MPALLNMTEALFTLDSLNPGVFRVIDAQGLHVGNLKQIAGQWKFKAVGYTPEGALVPGGGPLTGRHNQPVSRPDSACVAAALAFGAVVQGAPGQP